MVSKTPEMIREKLSRDAYENAVLSEEGKKLMILLSIDSTKKIKNRKYYFR